MIDYLLETALLLDMYGTILTDRQRNMLRMRYDEDLSLSEIASVTGVSRQAAQDAIARGMRQLMQLEDTFGFVKREQHILGELRKCVDLLKDTGGATAEARRILEIIISGEGGDEPDGIRRLD